MNWVNKFSDPNNYKYFNKLISKHILASMNYFDSDMSNSANTVVYFDWKTVIYIYVCGQVAHNLCCPIRADDNSSTCTFTTG